MSKTQKALRLALEALEESLGYVEKEAENAQRLYGQYPTRQARIQGLKDDARKHMDAITAIREALADHIPDATKMIEQPANVATVNTSEELVDKTAENVHEQPAHHAVDWEKLYLLEVKKKNALAAKYERDTGKKLTRIVPMADQPAQQEPVEEFAYKAITKRGEHCHFGTHAAARIWAGEGGEVETIKLRHLELVEQPAQPSKPWVGLTDNEWFDFWDGCEFVDGESVFPEFLEIAHAIEAKLREKNA